MTVDVNDPTGVRNVLASVVDHLQAMLVGETVIIGNYLQATKYPSVTVENDGLYSLGDMAYGDLIEEGVKGRVEQTQLEVNILAKASVESDNSALVAIRALEDKVRQALELAGLKSGIPTISIYDHSSGTPVDTGRIAWMPTELETAWLPKRIDDAENPALKRVRVYVRIYWEKLLNY